VIDYQIDPERGKTTEKRGPHSPGGGRLLSMRGRCGGRTGSVRRVVGNERPKSGEKNRDLKETFPRYEQNPCRDNREKVHAVVTS